MKYSLFFILIVAFGFQLAAQNPFSADLIPDSLKENAWAVIRQSETTFKRSTLNKYSMTVHKVITILNPKGERFSGIYVGYDQDSEISELKGYLYDAKGTAIGSIRKNDFSDVAATGSSTLLSDDRAKYFEPAINKYPYTIAYTYTVDYKSILKFSNWIPCEDFYVSVEDAKLTVSSPDEFDIRYKSRNYDFQFEEQKAEGTTTMSWSAKSLKASVYDYGRLGYYEIFPIVIVMPNQFSFDGFEGDFTSWETYGQWVYQLLSGRDELPQSTIAEIEKLTAGITDEHEKVKVLYKYLQQKTRYVAIMYGIGGFQPAPASNVDEKGYGDCKALSNYMRSLLEHVGIRAYYTEIGNGLDQKIIYPEFATASQTNHVILCVPFEQDTTWLECTSQNYPAGYIGTSNSDRYALMITEEGGKLVRTPVYRTNDNRRESTIRLNLSESGPTEVNLQSDFKNGQFEEIFGLAHLSRDDQKKILLRHLDADGLELSDYSVSDLTDTVTMARLNVNGKMSGVCSKAGTRLMVKPSFLFSNDFPKSLSKKRTTALYEPVGYEYCDSLVINLPESYEVEFTPEDKSLENQYGACNYRYQKNEKQMIIERKIHINKGTYEPDQFMMVNLFLAFCDKMDHTGFVLKKNN
ncbi:DUF3857 domain-containing protein [Mangrovibacterium diazotrophicum]|uniref:Uncharacterized protein DUF3858 n=1 Tax=Mangrovibacterium diazotrophicum TaxID=1261403 RepID=A0A419VX29_9BACT|nr:DUF3857 domain-containing protein [Mangrovibacterium diazotrophicum]RKD87792.1 uncharacterized protein DUF3858 [Mangrovibacterium diazotrophicum]